MNRAFDIQTAAREWVKNGLNTAQVEAELLKRGIDNRHIPEMLQEVKRLRNAHKTSTGLVLILIGGLICLLSCVLTITGTYSHSSFAFVLYGFTSVGIIIVFAGLMRIFG